MTLVDRISIAFTCVARAAAARISSIRFHVYFITQVGILVSQPIARSKKRIKVLYTSYLS